jgi:hypothetical protein
MNCESWDDPKNSLMTAETGLVVDELLRHQRLDVLQAHAFLDGTLHAHEADAVLVLDQLAHGPHAAVPEMVDVVDLADAVLQLDQIAHHLEDVLAAQRALLQRHLELELVVQLQAADLRQIVTLGIEEQVVEERGRGLGRGRIAGTQPPVDLQDGFLRIGDLILEQRVPERRPDVGVVHEQQLEARGAAAAQQLELLVGDLLVAGEQHLARLGILHVVGGDTADQLFDGDRHLLDAGLVHLAQHQLGELAPFLDEQLVALGMPDVTGGARAAEMLGLEDLRRLAAVEDDDVLAVEVVEEVLGGHAEGAEQHGGVELPPPVDAHEEDVARIELEVDPRAAVRDDAGGVEELAAGVRLALVVIEEHTRGAMELGDDHPLGPVHHEGAVGRHQRDLAEVDLLLLHVLDGAGAALGIDVPDDQLHGDLERGRERHVPLMALVDVVLGLREPVADELQRGGLVEVLDGKDRLEDRLQALVFPGLRRNVPLQELLVRPLLDLDQIGNVDDLANPAERSAQPQVIRDMGPCRDGVRHRVSLTTVLLT